MAYATQKGSWRKKAPFANVYFSSGTTQPTKPVCHGPMIPKFSVTILAWQNWPSLTPLCNQVASPKLSFSSTLCPSSYLWGTFSLPSLFPSLLFMGPFPTGVTDTVKMKTKWKQGKAFHFTVYFHHSHHWQSPHLRIVEFDKDLWGSTSPTPWSKQSQLEQVA